MKNNVFMKILLLVSLACIVGSSNAQTISGGTCTISDGSPGDTTFVGQQLPNRNITVTGNTVEGGSSAQDSRGIAILGGNGISVVGNVVRGHSGGRMIAGIKIDRATTLDGFPAVNVTVSGNTIIDGQITSFAAGTDSSVVGGIQLGACDSVIIANNIVNFSKRAFGIRLRAINTDEAFYRTSARAVQNFGSFRCQRYPCQ